jgi:hypothetical protein
MKKKKGNVRQPKKILLPKDRVHLLKCIEVPYSAEQLVAFIHSGHMD